MENVSRRRAATAAAVAILLSGATLSGCDRRESQQPVVTYVTEYGMGPDKWATAWLLSRRVDPKSRLVVTDAGTPLAEGISFDIPSSGIRRIGNRSAFQVAKGKFELNDPVLDELAGLVYEIEVNFWAAGGPPEAATIEEAYRALQYRHGRDAVAPECYVAFFDRVYEMLKDARLKAIPFGAQRLNIGCEELQFIADKGNELVPEVPIVDVLSAAAAGRKVIYVDVREPEEFVEGHIPGALNIPLRDLNSSALERLSAADYVVSYCVKDFRGFEMAKALTKAGVSNSVIMRPYGIKGWVALGLPITGTKSLDESQARAALEACLQNTESCLTDASRSI